MDVSSNAPRWRHPGFLLIYAMGASFAAAIVASGLGRLLPLHQGPAFVLLVGIGAAALFVVVFVLFRRHVEGVPATELAPRFALVELPAGILIGLILFSLIVAVIAAFGGYRVIGYRDASVLVPALAIAISSGFCEEIVFRGFFFRLTEQWLGTWWALGLSAALFGALHLGNPHATLLAGVAIMLEAGIMLAALYLLTRRLWMAIGLHGAWNFAQGGIYGIPVSGGAMDGVIRPDLRGSDLLTGGAFGAEASLPAIVVATAFGLLLLYLAYRRGRFILRRDLAGS
jgi:uncharacterized protein